MIKAISYWSLPDGLSGRCPVTQAITLAKNAGFQGIELSIGQEGVLTVSTDQATCQQYRSALTSAGIACNSLASGMSWGVSPTHPDPAIRQQSIALHQAALQRAAWLGASALLFVPGAVSIPWDSTYGPVDYAQAVEWAREAVTALLPTAQATGVDLCLENVWNGLFYSPVEFRDFVDSFHHPRLGVYLDVGNLLGYHQHPPHWISLLGARIRRIHLKDFKRSIGGLAGFCDLLAGDVPWAATIQALRAIGYQNTLVAEMMPPDPALLARTSAALDVIMQL
ncbi:MAG: sugar phosphate isomerase/epimerase family protein [Phycisphaerae bacterium]